jgi:hypothetical protein
MLSDNQKFDEATGQVYTETTASIQSADDRDWTRRTLGPSWRDSEDELQLTHSSQEGLKDYREYLHSVKSPKARRFKGVRSLQATSFEIVLQHISDITLEGLECLPVQVVRRLWHAVNRRSVYLLKPSQDFLSRPSHGGKIGIIPLKLETNGVSLGLFYPSILGQSSLSFYIKMKKLR